MFIKHYPIYNKQNRVGSFIQTKLLIWSSDRWENKIFTRSISLILFLRFSNIEHLLQILESQIINVESDHRRFWKRLVRGATYPRFWM